MTTIERIRKSVERQANGCILWTGACVSSGYGEISIEGKKHYVHRYMWQLFFGDIPEGHHMHHLCEVKPCINPSHLTPVSKHIHFALTVRSRGRWLPIHTSNICKLFCEQGHPFPENRYVSPNGRLYSCKKCQADRYQRSRQQFQ